MEKPDCRRCKAYFETQDCILEEIKKIGKIVSV